MLIKRLVVSAMLHETPFSGLAPRQDSNQPVQLRRVAKLLRPFSEAIRIVIISKLTIFKVLLYRLIFVFLLTRLLTVVVAQYLTHL